MFLSGCNSTRLSILTSLTKEFRYYIKEEEVRIMAHAKVQNAGQRYGSARKRRRKYGTVSETELRALRGAVDNRRRLGNVTPEVKEEILNNILLLHKQSVERSSFRY